MRAASFSRLRSNSLLCFVVSSLLRHLRYLTHGYGNLALALGFSRIGCNVVSRAVSLRFLVRRERDSAGPMNGVKFRGPGSFREEDGESP
jgi:hypothetical protein